MKMRIKLGIVVLLALPLLGVAQESSMSAESKSSRESGMDLTELIQRYAKRTGRKFIVDPRVRAVVQNPGIDVGQLTQEQLLAILDVHGFAAVELSGITTVLPDAGARQLPTPVHTDPNFKALDHEIVTLLLEVKNACAAHMVPVLRPLMPQAAHMAAYPPSNTLILTDHAVNVRRIAQLVERLDRLAPPGQKCPEMQAPPKPKE